MMQYSPHSLWFRCAIAWMMFFGAPVFSQTISSSSPMPAVFNIRSDSAPDFQRPSLATDDIKLGKRFTEPAVITITQVSFWVPTESSTPTAIKAPSRTPIHIAGRISSHFQVGNQVCSNTAAYWPLKKATLSYDEGRIEEARVEIVNPITSVEVLDDPSDSWYKPASQSPDLVYVQINMIHRSTQESGWIRAYVNAADVFLCRYKS